jgi:hypothetical protein
MAVETLITLGVGTPSDIASLTLTGLNAAGAAGGVTALDDDTTTAFAYGVRAMTGSLWMNEKLRENLNTTYGTSSTDLGPLLARYLKDVKS